MDSVESFLDLLESRLASEGSRELEKLWRGLKFARSSASSSDNEEQLDQDESEGLLGIGVLAEAFANLFRPDGFDADDTSISILGGRIWKDAYQGDWSREAWDLFYQFVACPGKSSFVITLFAVELTFRDLQVASSSPRIHSGHGRGIVDWLLSVITLRGCHLLKHSQAPQTRSSA